MKTRIPLIKYFDLGLGLNLNGGYVFLGELGLSL